MAATSARYDPFAIIGFATSILAILSCIFTVATISRDWRRRTDFARDVIDVHKREIGVLGHVLDECRKIIITTATEASAAEAGGTGGCLGKYSPVPTEVFEALRMCEQRQADLHDLLASSVLREAKKRSWFALNLRLPLIHKDLKIKYDMFKEDVMLLRVLCSELRSQQQSEQLVDQITVAIARHITGFMINMDADDAKTLSSEKTDIRYAGYEP
ncbi:hypothetical protein QBC47DRAFT_403892 [Echria macrotheca]|uniref:Uncharacterized protein n=1 Tax=Echria macrotheca TaxID=438768 RepID=A0AAJ0B976_9PEZI|nr:hypothetical protein QBC47DRAFT_403892 [Echria macrotheca]